MTPMSSSRDRGVILVVVLWLVAVLAILATSLSSGVRSGAAIVAHDIKALQNRALVDASIELAVARLISANLAAKPDVDGRAFEVELDGRRLVISVQDANGLIDLNTTDEAVLKVFFERMCGSQATASDLVQFVLARRAAFGAKPKRYERARRRQRRGQRRGRKTAERVFIDTGELRRAPAMTLGLWRKMSGFLTVHSADGRINPMTAPEPVLGAVPELLPADVRFIIAVRENPLLDDGQLDSINKRAGKRLTKSTGPAFVLTIRLERLGRGALTSQATILLKGSEQTPYAILGWWRTGF